MKNKRISFLFILLVVPIFLYAGNYRIHRIFGKGKITISGKTAYKNMPFNDKDLILCSSKSIGMTVIDVKTGRYIDVYGAVAGTKSITIINYQKSFRKYEENKLINKVPTRTKGVDDNNQYLYILYDSLEVHYPGYINKNAKLETVWYDGDEEIRRFLPTSDDNKCFHLTPSLFGDKKPQLIEVKIEATDDLGDPYPLKTIWVEPFPD